MTSERKPGEWLGEVVPVRRKRPDGIAVTTNYRIIYDARLVTRHWTPEGVVDAMPEHVEPEKKQRRNRRKG